jgi:hypothetical protein
MSLGRSANHQVELAEALEVGDQVDLDDLPAGDREGEYDARPSGLGPHGSRRSVQERWLCEPGSPEEGIGHGRRTADLVRRADLHGRAVGTEDDV